ncbi:unnamed protein product [Rangifer tarandus platyrhynchus]|uniref:Uncharacterized protein n=1 Tax=Rangifer tarandus platyrhynchus TaxID=3082113 RepID=A0ABN8ZC99_RANTA|nr:unnamed protein product [Rangifer tarandus platyrhynchus]
MGNGLRPGGGAEEPFGESPPPLETINKGPKRCTFLHTRPKTHLGEPRVRETSRAELRKHLSPSLSRNLLETWKLREQIFSLRFPPSCPPPTDPRAGAGEPDSQRARGRCDRRQRAAGRPRRDSPEPRRQPPLARSPGVPSRAPSPSQATSGRRLSALTLAFPRPRPPTPAEEQKEGSAGSPLGRRGGGGADSSAAAPHTKGLPTPGRGVGALVPAPRTGSHPPAGVCASVHRNAGSEGGLREPGRAGWTGRDGGEGRRERGRREVCNGTSHDAHRANGRRCPEAVWTDLPATHTRARTSSVSAARQVWEPRSPLRSQVGSTPFRPDSRASRLRCPSEPWIAAP